MNAITQNIHNALNDLETRELERLILTSSFGNKNAPDVEQMLFHRVLFDAARQTLRGRETK
jgi:hypothetical protein